jgi:hypothetical protein
MPEICVNTHRRIYTLALTNGTHRLKLHKPDGGVLTPAEAGELSCLIGNVVKAIEMADCHHPMSSSWPTWLRQVIGVFTLLFIVFLIVGALLAIGRIFPWENIGRFLKEGGDERAAWVEADGQVYSRRRRGISGTLA